MLHNNKLYDYDNRFIIGNVEKYCLYKKNIFSSYQDEDTFNIDKFIIKTFDRKLYFGDANNIKLIASDVDDMGQLQFVFYISNKKLYYVESDCLNATKDVCVNMDMNISVDLFIVNRYVWARVFNNKLYINSNESLFSVNINQIVCCKNYVLFTEVNDLYVCTTDIRKLRDIIRDLNIDNIERRTKVFITSNVTQLVAGDDYFAFLTEINNEITLHIYNNLNRQNPKYENIIKNIKYIYGYHDKLAYVTADRKYFIIDRFGEQNCDSHVIPFIWSPKTHYFVISPVNTEIITFLMIIYRQFKQMIPRPIRYIIISNIVH